MAKTKAGKVTFKCLNFSCGIVPFNLLTVSLLCLKLRFALVMNFLFFICLLLEIQYYKARSEFYINTM